VEKHQLLIDEVFELGEMNGVTAFWEEMKMLKNFFYEF
jgi:hypothetical protein